jgi:hypothetical protein
VNIFSFIYCFDLPLYALTILISKNIEIHDSLYLPGALDLEEKISMYTDKFNSGYKEHDLFIGGSREDY